MTIDEIRALTVWDLATLAGCLAPDTATSPGAMLLKSVWYGVVEAIENDELDEDTAHTLADDAPSVYTHELWSEFVDLGAYQEDTSELYNGSDLSRHASVALYLITERLVHALTTEA